jgi:t-SNARE complex subunit (syntaxin)
MGFNSARKGLITCIIIIIIIIIIIMCYYTHAGHLQIYT